MEIGILKSVVLKLEFDVKNWYMHTKQLPTNLGYNWEVRQLSGGVLLACVASVSVEQRAKNGVFGGFRCEKWGESKNKKEGVGEGRAGRKRLQPSIVILKTAHLACHA